MAAPAIPSPSHAAMDTKKPTAAPSSSYLTTKHSSQYTEAKAHLSSGRLDECLSCVEAQLVQLRNRLEADDKEEQEEKLELDLHESLCPLHYLYGTTLLYLVEENESMMAGKPSAPETVEPEQNNDEEDEEVADPAEDLQIAWENLDIARTILSRLVENFDPTAATDNTITLKTESVTKAYTKEEENELLLDLAQIHTRLGDVQRANGNTSAVEDYSRSLDIRRAVLGDYDKLVADNHYCLAQAYGEAPSKEKEREDGAMGIVAALGGGGEGVGGEDAEGMSKEEIADCLVKSVDHYLACGISFAGYLAKMCGKDPDELTKVESAAAASASENHQGNTHSKMLEVIRQRVAELKPMDEKDMDRFNDTKEILDEIQETLDAAEGSEEALKAVHAMKKSEIRKHSGNEAGEEVVDESGATTTIGFGAADSSVAAAAASTNIGFGTATSGAAAAGAPMMVVKKKKKPANDGGAAAKRAKSE